MTLDKYARDSTRWCESAIQNHLAARILFTSGNPIVIFTAATIAHHALEMYLKSALIVAGLAIFNPNQIRLLDAVEALTQDRCAWGHNLSALARKLAVEQPVFDLRMELDLSEIFIPSLALPLTVEGAFEHFEPFFDEIRYPREYENFFGVGTDENLILDELARALRPFLPESCRGFTLIDE